MTNCYDGGPITLRCLVTGRVQGVGYRVWARATGDRLGLSGWARNDPDGSVTVVVHGPRETVLQMVAALHEGPSAAKVGRVETITEDDTPAKGGFAIRR